MKRRYLCIHGHFYQPPRENAWLEAVELQESAFPAHDWNERITQECYETNAKARLLDSQGLLDRVVSNYERISYNFGPTLLAWMKEKAPDVYTRLIKSDAASAARFNGHGSAMAQGYGHAILPLCNDRDRRTQVLWGMRDFQSRFNRVAEGMWMPETAVSTPTLEALADAGVKFTILAPRQCDAVRRIGDDQWNPIGSGVDPTQPYLCRLPSGRQITLFFYDGPVSQGVAFEGLLNSGDRFADRLLSGFDDARPHDQLMHIATDGESYGHHHRHGEMALAAALEKIDKDPSVELVNYALFLSRNPPAMEARIHENSSWSCVHGLERWRSDCGCNSQRGGFHQKWRAPLRDAFDWLRDAVTPKFEQVGRSVFADPWAARDAYIDVILDRGQATISKFLTEHARHELSAAERVTALKLMELQRHAMLMYTSCAWFFDDVAGIETVQVIQYSARVVQLAQQVLGLELENEFLSRLEKATGSIEETPDARTVYERIVRPAMLTLERFGAHHAVARLFEATGNRAYAFEVHHDLSARHSSGRARLVVGNATFRSRVDLEESRLSYCALHLGDHTVSCGVRPYAGDEAFARVRRDAEMAFDRADFAGVLRLMDREFGGTSYSISSLFRDEQHGVVRRILEPALEQVDQAYRTIYDQNASMARFLKSMNLTVPRRIQMVGSFVLSQSFRKALAAPQVDLVRAAELIHEAQRSGIELDELMLNQAVADAMKVAIATARVRINPASDANLLALVRFIQTLPCKVDTWPLQEYYVDCVRPRLQAAQERDGDSVDVALFRELGTALEVRI